MGNLNNQRPGIYFVLIINVSEELHKGAADMEGVANSLKAGESYS